MLSAVQFPDIPLSDVDKNRGHRVAAVGILLACRQSASTSRTVRLSVPALRRQK
jgi:hypothetical protein